MNNVNHNKILITKIIKKNNDLFFIFIYFADIFIFLLLNNWLTKEIIKIN